MDDLTFVTDLDYDKVIIEKDHQRFSLDTFRISVQRLFSRKKIEINETLQTDPVPLARIPPDFSDG